MFGPPPKGPGVTRIVCGGQAGADRGGAEAAHQLGIELIGWVPAGRRAEDGEIPAEVGGYLRETPKREYRERTIRNVVIADAVLVFTWGAPGKGSSLTVASALRFEKPYLQTDLSIFPASGEYIGRTLALLKKHAPRSLMVAGSRASRHSDKNHIQGKVAEIVSAAVSWYNEKEIRT